MRDMLSQLNHRSPSMGGKLFLAIFTLLPMFREFYNETFLHLHILDHFFLDGQFDLDSSGMGFGVDEIGIDDFNCLETSDFL